MIKREIYEVEEGDLERLKQPLPVNPCTKCSSRHICALECTTCDKYDNYRKIEKSFEEHNLLEFAEKLRTVRENRRNMADKLSEIQMLKEETEEVEKELISAGLDAILHEDNNLSHSTFVTTQMHDLLKKLADVAEQASQEVFDDGVENGTSRIIRTCREITSEIDLYFRK